MTKYREIIEAGIPDEGDLRNLAFLNVNRQLNCVSGIRPSDAARDEVRDYERLGADGYRARFRSSRENRSNS